MLRVITTFPIAIALLAAVGICPQLHAETPGLMAEPPAEGRSVKTDQGYMVEYTDTIPGTDVTFAMVPVPGGEYEFKQGDKTLHVQIEPFWMSKTEVTWAEYKKFMNLAIVFAKFDDQKLRQVTDENKLDAVTAPSKLYDPGFTYDTGDEPNQPAVSMTQFAAKQYTKWLSLLGQNFYRLPSEAEWEYACRAGSTTLYSFGDDEDELEEYAWYDDMNDMQTGPVGKKKPNAWGLHDMHGNAGEWVLDSANPPADGPADGSKATVDQAVSWPTEVFPRVVKGGSWDSMADECTVTSRAESSQDWKSFDPNVPSSSWWFASYEGQLVGFRLVRPLQAPERSNREKYWQADLPVILDHANRRIDEEGKGERGIVDPELPQAIEKIQ
ncbi:formylglycine-generating enzyme family protein [Aeoliella mucimassa]|uniref:Formylglycine-generating sulfatase enzyme n=1 Tax=Aeoliella mucimassa TaxID=2527972 RepID=A0A518ALJ8_9BACT|nr:formylglycine-generating enzyme family protein [Aeoliella mucimassa]QDU55603.1 Formylglycine-generating sulfatase enzyme [Aeoliella mucimassa]